MDIFELPFKETEKQIDNILSNTTPDELLEELIQCGLEVTMNEEKAIEILKTYLEYPEMDSIEMMKEAIETVLNLIEKQQAEIETLQRDFKIVDHECSRLEQEDIRKDMIIKEMAKAWKQDDIRGIEEIIEYFENKVKESK